MGKLFGWDGEGKGKISPDMSFEMTKKKSDDRCKTTRHSERGS
jgi:hypothetical protein